MFIPESLWSGSTLHLAKPLRDFYISQLHALNRFAEAKGPNPAKPPIGGASRQATEDHLVHRFPNSCARSTYVALDPEKSIGDASRLLRSALTEGDVCMFDVPCGAGEGAAAILVTLAEIRRLAGVNLPLRVHVIGADYSPRALELFDAHLASIRSACLDANIKVTHDTVLWDVLKLEQHEQLFARNRVYTAETVVVISNFSGAMADASISDAVHDFFEYTCKRLSQSAYTAVWFEPGGRYRKRVVSLFASVVKKLRFAQFIGASEQEYHLMHPCSNASFKSEVSVWACRREAQ